VLYVSMVTKYRPRIKQQTNDKLKDIKQEVKWLRNNTDKDLSKFKGTSGDVTEDKIIREALKALERRGLTDVR